jgi:hypothetical protein
MIKRWFGALGDRSRRAIVLCLAERPRRRRGRRHPPHLPAHEAGVAALRDQLDTFWNRALSGYQDVVDLPTEEHP